MGPWRRGRHMHTLQLLYCVVEDSAGGLVLPPPGHALWDGGHMLLYSALNGSYCLPGATASCNIRYCITVQLRLSEHSQWCCKEKMWWWVSPAPFHLLKLLLENSGFVNNIGGEKPGFDTCKNTTSDANTNFILTITGCRWGLHPGLHNILAFQNVPHPFDLFVQFRRHIVQKTRLIVEWSDRLARCLHKLAP